MTEPLIWLIVLPLAWATLAFVLGPGRGAWLAMAGLTIQTVLAWELAAEVTRHGAVYHAVGAWQAPLGIDLAVDGLSAAMLLITQVVTLPLAVYAASYFKAGDKAATWFWPLLGYLTAGLNALFASEDLFNLYVTLELVGLSAVALVAIGGGARQIEASLRYLFATLIGSGAYLLGVALLYATYGTVSIAVLTPLIHTLAPSVTWIAAGLMLTGLMLKTALFPFHYWLPPAHGGAAAPVSALLSALVVKASFYLILRLSLGPLQPMAPAYESLAALLGTAAIGWGSWQAIRAVKLKRLIAYSTVAQLGYLFLVFPLLGSAGALQASVMQVFAHALAKAGMFAAAGALIKASGQDTVAGLAGVVERLPLTVFAFALAGVSLMGLPPSSGFLAKWLIIETALARGNWWIPAVVLCGSLLSATYIFRVLRTAFLPAAGNAPVNTVPRALQWCAFALAGASVLLGLRGVELVRLAWVH